MRGCIVGCFLAAPAAFGGQIDRLGDGRMSSAQPTLLGQDREDPPIRVSVSWGTVLRAPNELVRM